uniref:Uncharacterized protein n=1 Tax=Anguilla anguilla TaxID=7936 RepID=A0A0E9VFM1_ANGAN
MKRPRASSLGGHNLISFVRQISNCRNFKFIYFVLKL